VAQSLALWALSLKMIVGFDVLARNYLNLNVYISIQIQETASQDILSSKIPRCQQS